MLGYIAYFLICAFGPIQLFSMIRQRTFDLGHLPIASLVIGLALLQIQVMRDGEPLYLVIGNGAALGFNLLNIAWMVGFGVVERRRMEQRLRDTRYTLTPAGRAVVDGALHVPSARITRGDN